MRRQCGPDDSQGGDRRDVEVDAEEERAHGVDPMTIGEIVGKAPAVRAWRRSMRCRRCRRGGGRGEGTWVAKK
jgi:hypothetical protein